MKRRDFIKATVPIVAFSQLSNHSNAGTSTPTAQYRNMITCDCLDDLLQTEPEYEGQSLLLIRAIINGPVLNEIFIHDSYDLSSEQDGVSIFRTKNGACWKADISNGYNPLLLGFTESDNNLAECINRLILIIVKKAVSNSTDYIYNYTIKIAPPSNDAKCYYMKHSIVSPSFLSFNFLAATVFDYKFATNTNAFIIDNSLFPELRKENLSKRYSSRQIMSWNTESSFFVGAKIILNHPTGEHKNFNCGLLIGNSKSGYIDARGTNFSNFSCFGFYYGLCINSFDTYILSFNQFHFGRNNIAICILGSYKENAGEKITFINGTIADSDSDLIYIENNAFELFFSNCSLDYPTGDLIKIKNNGNSYISFNQCHIEGVQGCLVNVIDSTLYPRFGKKIIFSNCMIDLHSGQKEKFKTWFFSSTPNTFILVDESTRIWLGVRNYKDLGSSYYALVPFSSKNKVLIKWHQSQEDLYHNSLVPLAQVSYDSTSLISINTFSGIAHQKYTANKNKFDADGWFVSDGDWFYGEKDKEGYQSLKVLSYDSKAEFDLTYGVPIHDNIFENYRFFGLVEVGDDFKGRIEIAGFLNYHFLEEEKILKPNLTRKIIGTKTIVSKDFISQHSNLISFATYPVKVPQENKFFVTLPFLVCGIQFTGFTGTIAIKLPAVANDKLLS